MVFGESFRVTFADKEKEDAYKKLNALHAKFREISTNYNLAVKELHSHFSESKTMTLLHKLESSTKEMCAIARRVVALVKETESQWNV